MIKWNMNYTALRVGARLSHHIITVEAQEGGTASTPPCRAVFQPMVAGAYVQGMLICSH